MIRIEWTDQALDRVVWTDHGTAVIWEDRALALEDGIYSKLTNAATITALVDYRIYPGFLPQDAAMPAISYWRVTGAREHGQGTDPGVAEPVIQFDIWAAAYPAAQNIGDALRTLLQDGRGTWGSTTVIGVLYQGDTHLYESDQKRHHIAAEYNIWHLESRT